MSDTPGEAGLAGSALTFSRALRSRHAAALLDHGLHPGQDLLLMCLWQSPGIRLADLARQLEVEPPTVTKMISRLERSGLVERRTDPDDARVTLAHPTPRSRLLEAMVRRVWAELEDALLEGMPAADVDALHRLLTVATTALRPVDR